MSAPQPGSADLATERATIAALRQLPPSDAAAVERVAGDPGLGALAAALLSPEGVAPLAGFDRDVTAAAKLADADGLKMVFQPGMNEELAATAVMGTQLAVTVDTCRYDGVIGIWYGKAPGLDRASDALRHAVFAGDAKFLRAQTTKRVKFTLPGPMTMVDTLYDAHYRSREKLAWAFAEILNAEAREIAATGVDVIQFDEPAFNVFFDEVRDWGVRTLERAAQGLTCTTAVHICYGYGIKANIDWKNTLGSEWRQYEQTFPLLAASAIDQVSLECANSHVPIDLIGLLGGKDVLVGAIDVATERVESPEDVAKVIRSALRFVPPERLHPCTNCGMVPLPRDVARAKLEALGAGAALVRAELG